MSPEYDGPDEHTVILIAIVYESSCSISTFWWSDVLGVFSSSKDRINIRILQTAMFGITLLEGFPMGP